MVIFYKGEDIIIHFKSVSDISDYTKVVKVFTPFSSPITATINEIDELNFTATISDTQSSGLKTGTLNIVLEFSLGGNTIISKSVECQLNDAYLNGGARESTSQNKFSVSFNEVSLNVSFESANYGAILEVTQARDEAIQAKQDAQAILETIDNLDSIGILNASTGVATIASGNVTLTSTPPTGWINGQSVTVQTAGNIGFTGVNFTSGTTLQIGDELRKRGTQWELLRFAVGDGTITEPKISKDAKIIKDWEARAYLQNAQVIYTDGFLYECNANCASTDIPSISGKWTKKLKFLEESVMQITTPKPPNLYSTNTANSYWNPSGVIASQTGYYAINKVSCNANDIFAIAGFATAPAGTQVGRFFNTYGGVVRNILTTDFSVITGGYKLTIPNDSSIVAFGLNLTTTILTNPSILTIQLGGSIITEEVKVMKDKYLPTPKTKLSEFVNDVPYSKISDVLKGTENVATPVFNNQIWGTGGTLSANTVYLATSKINCSALGYLTLQGCVGLTTTSATQVGRYFDSAGSVLGNILKTDFLPTTGGFVFQAQNLSGLASVAFNFLKASQLDTNNQDGSLLVVQQGQYVNRKELINAYVPDIETSTDKALRMYNRGMQAKIDTSSKMPCYLFAGQSNTDGRIDLSELPAWWTSAGNTIVDVIINNSTSSTTNNNFHQYSTADYGLNSGVSYFSYVALLLKKLIDNQKAVNSTRKIYAVQRALGGTSISATGAGTGRWTPEFEKIPSNIEKLLSTLETRINFAKADSTYGNLFDIKALIWHQGESDNSTIDANLYYENLKMLIWYIRGVTGKPTLPVILGGISKLSLQYHGAVEEAKIKLASEQPNFIFYAPVSNNSSYLKSDSLHFNFAGADELATNIFNIMIANKSIFGLV